MKKIFFASAMFILMVSLSCKNQQANTNEVDKMISKTDSLLEAISKVQADLVDSIYRISGKKLIDIGPTGKISAKDSLRFYLLLQEISNKLQNIYQYSHKEILFSHYQLESIKEDILEAGEINSIIKDELITENDVLLLLEQRVDSSILLMNGSIDQIYKFLGDTLSLTISIDSIR